MTFSHQYPSGSSTLAIAIVLPILCIFAVGLRFYVRKEQRASIKVDDWLTIPALILTIGLGIDIIAGYALHSLGWPTPNDPVPSRTVRREDINVSNDAITIASQTEWAFYLISIVDLCCIKMSFLFFYKRCFCTGKRTWFDYCLYAMMGIVISWAIAFFFANLFACGTHFDAWWGSFANLQAQCIKTEIMLYGYSVSDVITDGLILIMPLSMIWKLNMALARKLAVTGIFLLGLMSVLASILKLVALLGSFGTDISIDEDLLITEFLWWCMLEAGLALIACCLPTLRFLFKGLSPESVIRSVRSIISLHSLGSQKSSRERIPDEESGRYTKAQKPSDSGPHEDFKFNPDIGSHSALANKVELQDLDIPQTANRIMVEERVDVNRSEWR